MAYGLQEFNITDNNWHLVTNKEAIIQCSRDFIFRYGTSTAPDNTDDSGVQAPQDFLVSNGSSNSYVYIKRLDKDIPLSVTVTGDVE